MMETEEFFDAQKELTQFILLMLDSEFGSIKLLVLNCIPDAETLSHILNLWEIHVIEEILFVGLAADFSDALDRIKKVSANDHGKAVINELQGNYLEGNFSQVSILQHIAEHAGGTIMILTRPKGWQWSLRARTKLKEVWGKNLLKNDILVCVSP